MGDEIYTVAQTAQYLKVCDKTVRRLIASNKLVASRIGGRSLRIKKEDIDAYLAEHTNKEKGVAINEGRINSAQFGRGSRENGGLEFLQYWRNHT